MGTEKKFDSEEDIPDLSGKVILITEGTTNPGLQSALVLAAHNPSHIYLTGRDTTKGVLAAQELERLFPSVTATFIACDLSSLSTVALAAHQFTSASPRLDILICNAAAAADAASTTPSVAAASKLPGTVTRDGYEMCFGTNHIAHALLIKLLLPTLLRTVDAPFSSSTVRIVLSTATGSSPPPPPTPSQSRCGFLPAVGAGLRGVQNRLASLLYAQELARRYPSITAVAVNPGAGGAAAAAGGAAGRGAAPAPERRATGWLCLDRALACVTSGCSGPVTAEEGLRTQLWAATATTMTTTAQTMRAEQEQEQKEMEKEKESEEEKGPEQRLVSGGFYERVGVVGSMGVLEGLSGKLARQLWEWTAKELGAFEA